jgi:phosphatidylinositol dimannoside acyltransferase
MPGLKDRLTDAGDGLGWSVVCRLPESWAQGAFRFFADLAWRRQGPGVQVLEGNLRRVIGSQAPGGQLRGLSRQVMCSYARYWLEAFRLPVMPAGRLVGGMRDTGHLRAAFEHLAAGREVVFALPHMGNYDLAGAWVIAKGAGSITTVAERLKPESVYDRFVAFREGLGVEVLPASGGTAARRGRRPTARRTHIGTPAPLRAAPAWDRGPRADAAAGKSWSGHGLPRGSPRMSLSPSDALLQPGKLPHQHQRR